MMEKHGEDAVMAGRGSMWGVQRMWDEYWFDHRPPDHVMDALIEQNGECHQCDGPTFVEVEGESGCKYCSDECAEANNDERSESSTDCDRCGHRFDSYQEGYYLDLTGSNACDDECAWNSIFENWDVERWFADRLQWNEAETTSNIRHRMRPSDIGSIRDLADAVQEHGVPATTCDTCDDPISEDDEIFIKDIHAYYDSDLCAWEGIEAYSSSEMMRKLQSRYKLSDLLNFNGLDDAIAQIESEEE
jgi:hypothetical protein